jgi:hypothetical protein
LVASDLGSFTPLPRWLEPDPQSRRKVIGETAICHEYNNQVHVLLSIDRTAHVSLFGNKSRKVTAEKCESGELKGSSAVHDTLAHFRPFSDESGVDFHSQGSDGSPWRATRSYLLSLLLYATRVRNGFVLPPE